jgi:8-oxo-dGTP diphosphatase
MRDIDVNFCPRCGSKVEIEFRFGKDRKVCTRCGWIFFADPKVAVAVLIVEDGEVLLVQRDNQPQRGKWSLPAGFVDAGEEPILAAERECLEEAGVQVQIEALIDVLSGQEHPNGAHILIAYKGRIVGGNLQPGDDALQAAFFGLDNLPPLAFKSVESILSHHN